MYMQLHNINNANIDFKKSKPLYYKYMNYNFLHFEIIVLIKNALSKRNENALL